MEVSVNKMASSRFFFLLPILFPRCSVAQLTLDVFENSAMVGTPIDSRHLNSLSNFSILNPHNSTDEVDYSARILGSIDLKSISSSFAIQCQFSEEMSAALVWIDDHLVCQKGLYNMTDTSYANQMDGTPNTPLSRLRRKTLLFRAHFWLSSAAKNSIRWSLMNSTESTIATTTRADALSLVDKNCVYTDIPSSVLIPAISETERSRIVMAEKVTQGWGIWNHNSIFDFILLPEGLRVSLKFCNSHTGQCWDEAIPSQDFVRVTAPIASDFSFLRYHVYLANHKVHITISMSGKSVAGSDNGGGSKDRLLILVETVQCDCCCEDMQIHFVGDIAYAPLRSGTISKRGNGTALNLQSSGLRSIGLFPDNNSVQILENGNDDELVVRIAPVGEALGLSTGNGPMPVSNIRAELKAMEEIERAKYQHIYPNDSFMIELLMAIQAAVIWNWIYTPAEFSPLAPVSRGWNFIKNGYSADFHYVIFDWDNELASLLLTHTTAPKEMAYSNFIQVVRSKTFKGFIPNFAAGGMKSQDRTEPPLGAKVLEEIYKIYNDKWIVELLWDDLADNIDWFFRERLLHGLIALGSDIVSYQGRWAGHDMQCARFESGLDNSPMYDGDFFDPTTNSMQMHDVGMTSLVIMELKSLARLAVIIDRPDDVIGQIKNRAKQLSDHLSDRLWDETQGIFANRFWNGTFSTRISPTSFYPLLTDTPSVSQVSSMMKNWLLNSSRFCIDPAWPDSLNSDNCWWGLPSISADDPAFPKLGYWRGYVWGPMAQIVYWSLSNKKYLNLPSVKVARKALSKQMTGIFMNVWKKHGRVCENFSPRREVDNCTGDYFYHWGALCGLLTITEEASDVNTVRKDRISNS